MNKEYTVESLSLLQYMIKKKLVCALYSVQEFSSLKRKYKNIYHLCHQFRHTLLSWFILPTHSFNDES